MSAGFLLSFEEGVEMSVAEIFELFIEGGTSYRR
jgi:hypothetical protein